MTLHLSRLLLSPRSRQVISEIAYPYEMYLTMMRAFPKVTDNEKSGPIKIFHGLDPVKPKSFVPPA